MGLCLIAFIIVSLCTFFGTSRLSCVIATLLRGMWQIVRPSAIGQSGLLASSGIASGSATSVAGCRAVAFATE